jgi:flagellar basal-body rod modification protein FlgD
MSSTVPINNAATTAPTATVASTASAQDELNFNQFLNIMTTELENQDPLNPTSDTEYFSQLAQMGTVQGVDNVQQTLQVSEASSLLGHTVTATVTANGVGVNVTGKVVGLSNQNGVYQLAIQDSSGAVTFAPVSSVQAVAN